jgi:hypothetical protein
MSTIAEVAFPTEPVTRTELKNFAKVYVTSDDTMCDDLITAARQYVEDNTGLSLVSRAFIQFEDGLPSIPFGFSGYAYSASQNAYFGYGPLTPYPPMGWQPRCNPFEMTLMRNPVTAVEKIEYVHTDGTLKTLLPNADFDVDLISTPARIAPLTGQRWPQGMIGTNNVRIYFTAGAGGPTNVQNVTETGAPTPPDQLTSAFNRTNAIPRALKIAIMQLANHWYSNREPVAGGTFGPVPYALEAIIKSYRVLNTSQPVSRY